MIQRMMWGLLCTITLSASQSNIAKLSLTEVNALLTTFVTKKEVSENNFVELWKRKQELEKTERESQIVTKPAASNKNHFSGFVPAVAPQEDRQSELNSSFEENKKAAQMALIADFVVNMQPKKPFHVQVPQQALPQNIPAIQLFKQKGSRTVILTKKTLKQNPLYRKRKKTRKENKKWVRDKMNRLESVPVPPDLLSRPSFNKVLSDVTK